MIETVTGRRAESHPWCRMSVAGWGVAGLLAVYLLFMHSTFFMERRGMWAKWQTHWEAQYGQAVTQATADLDAMRKATESSLRFLWAARTPEIERDVHLQQQLTELQDQVTTLSTAVARGRR